MQEKVEQYLKKVEQMEIQNRQLEEKQNQNKLSLKQRVAQFLQKNNLFYDGDIDRLSVHHVLQFQLKHSVQRSLFGIYAG